MCELVLGFGRDRNFTGRDDTTDGASYRLVEWVMGFRARRKEHADRAVRALSSKALRDIGLGRVYDYTFSVRD